MLRVPIKLSKEGLSESGVYIIMNTFNGKIYVGSSIHIKQRWKEHITDLQGNKHKNVYLQKSWNKYGRYSFTFFIIEEVIGIKSLIQREQYWIDYFQAANSDYGYNINSKADRVTYTKEVRQKLSEKTKTYMNNPEVKQHIGELSRQRGDLRKFLQTEEGKLHLYQLAHGEKTEKQLNAMLEWSRSEEGREHTRQLGMINRAKKAKTVYQYTPDKKLVQVYYTPTDVNTEVIGCHNNSIARVCRENQGKTNKKVFKGYIWSYEPLF